LQAGIIDEKIFVGLVVMTMVTILVAGPLMKFYLEKDIKEKSHVAAEEEVVVISETQPDVIVMTKR
jgi:hypothetical protein